MSPFDTVLDAIREFWLTCIGSPQSRTRQRIALAKLDAHLLKDIGLTPEEARQGAFLHSSAPQKRATPGISLRQPTPNR